MQARLIRYLGAATLACCLSMLSLGAAHAQAVPNTKAPIRVSRVDLYGGYAYIRPLDADVNNYYDKSITIGAVASASLYFNNYLGVQAEGGFHPHGPDDCIFTAQAGPVARYQLRRVVPFAHVLGGGAKIGGPVFQPCTWGWGVTGGVGVDYILPGFGDHLAVRPIQADYEYNHVDYGPLVLPGGYAGGLIKMNAVRLSGGVVLRLGDIESAKPAVVLSCAVQPMQVFAGEPVTVTAQTLNLLPKRQTDYTWSSTGGQISGKGETVTIATAGLAPGSYNISGKVAQGAKPDQMASCTASFEVKAMEPPTITCSADPSTLQPGGSATITSIGTSPQNRTLTYSYAASAGSISGSGTKATLNSAGALAGPITITCNVVDDLGKPASATTTVTVLAPVVPPAPKTQPLCSISFDRDHTRPVRVDNEAKACLDDIALTMNRQSDSKLVIVGSHDKDEPADFGAERAVNTKLYLTREKGIDGARIRIRSGHVDGRKVEDVLIPTGANYDESGSDNVDETNVKTRGQAYGVPKKRN